MKNKYLRELLHLVEENPDLPVIPMVECEVVPDDGCERWISSFGAARVTEYIQGKEYTHFRDTSDVEDVIADVFDKQFFAKLTDQGAKVLFETLEWKQVIVVNIDMAD